MYFRIDSKKCMRNILKISSLLLLTLISCKKESTSNSEIDSAIIIDTREQLNNDRQTLLLVCTTQKIYGCGNYSIHYKIDKTTNRIDIAFEGIKTPNICLTSLGPATTFIDLGTLPIGLYQLNLTINRTVKKGELVVTPDRYSISIPNQTQIQLPKSTLPRIPSNTIWGTIGYNKASSEPMAQSVVDALIQTGATTQTYAEGNYWYFNIGTNGQILSPQNHGYWFVKPFILQYLGDIDKIKTLLQQIKTQYGNELHVTINTSKGEVLYN